MAITKSLICALGAKADDISMSYHLAMKFLTIYFILMSTIIVYRLYFHPLAGVPGPLLAKISGWPNWVQARAGRRHIQMQQLHDLYGSVVRFAPNAISINTPAGLKEIYGVKRSNIVKSDWYRCIHYFAGGYQSTLTLIDQTRHSAKRRLLSHAFSDSALRGVEQNITSLIHTWIELLGNGVTTDWSAGLDMDMWATCLIYDILGDLAFGKSFKTMQSEENRFLLHTIPQATKTWYSLGYHPMAHLILRLMFKTPLGTILGGKAFRDDKRFRAFCGQHLKERREIENSADALDANQRKKDFFHYLLRGRDPETGLGYMKGELEAETVLLIVAGSESVSVALAACLFYIGRDTAVLEKLTTEIRESFSTSDEILYSNTSFLALPYLRACIDEAMRMTPPTPGHLPREVLEDGIAIEGQFYHAGTIVGVSAYAMHHNEAYFPQSFSFIPERWIVNPENGVSAESVALARSAFCPFSAGSRGCIGKQLAYVELSLAIARLLWNFDIRALPGDTTGAGGPNEVFGRHRAGEYQLEDVFVAKKEGPILQLKARSS
ncbi:cytochrome p450 family protein [Phlyctema vagabunda]|uniref:Cytochrome p450 family protein n=1 Tax=Phlyctema vagabunda TaxID=108571 RepID=A0ABR4PRJ8_9HELO